MAIACCVCFALQRYARYDISLDMRDDAGMVAVAARHQTQDNWVLLPSIVHLLPTLLAWHSMCTQLLNVFSTWAGFNIRNARCTHHVVRWMPVSKLSFTLHSVAYIHTFHIIHRCLARIPSPMLAYEPVCVILNPKICISFIHTKWNIPVIYFIASRFVEITTF